MNVRYQRPRRQAERLAELVSREGSNFHSVVLAKRGEGKTDLLQQVHARLFERAEGPVPFLYGFAGAAGDAPQDELARARQCFASFCQQVRAFLMRQEELLGEPVALLEREMERPGLPLSLTELAQQFLTLPAGHPMAFVAGLPAQFAHVERRPVCWLLDDAQELGHRSPIFAALDSSGFSWLLSGRDLFLRRLAGERGWPVVPLEPFSVEEALALTGQQCRAADLPFSPEAWEEWLPVIGTSPWFIRSLVDAAAVQRQPLESLEEIGRLYLRELSSGALGNWLAARWERALPERRDRVAMARFLEGLARSGLPESAPALTPAVWDSLVAEEWAIETPLGPRLQLGTVQWDWLGLVATSQSAFPQRAEARALQALLLRAEQNRERRQVAERAASVRKRLLELPQRGFPADLEWRGEAIHPPEICSVCSEPSGSAELFWCYGFHGNRRDIPEAAYVVLIALCEKEPAPGEIEAWRRELENEERLLPAGVPGTPRPEKFGGSRGEVWLVVPGEFFPPIEGRVRRFPPGAFLRMLEVDEAPEPRH